MQFSHRLLFQGKYHSFCFWNFWVFLENKTLTTRIKNKCRYLAPRPATMFRNRVCVDGGLTLFMPPTAAAKTVCTWLLCCFVLIFSFLFACSVSCSFHIYELLKSVRPFQNIGSPFICIIHLTSVDIYGAWTFCINLSQVRVCAFSASNFKLKGIEICPDCNPLNRATARQVSAQFLLMRSFSFESKCLNLGFSDT